MAVNVHLTHASRSFQGLPLGRRTASRDDGRFGDFLLREESSSQPADVLPQRAFVSANNRFTGKDSHLRSHLKPREHLSAEKHHKVERRPEYTSLADVYETSLRNVLNIQLQLTLDDQPSEPPCEPLRCNKSSPPLPRGDPYRDYKLGLGPGNDPLRHHRVEEEQRLVTSGYPLQGRTELRNPRRITSSEGSAFHVPSKRQPPEIRNHCEPRLAMDRYGIAPPPVDYPLYSRATAYPGNRVGLTRENEYRYGTQGMYLTSSQAYLDPWHKRRSREVPPLFPVRCTPVEQRTEMTQAKEYFSRKQERAAPWRLNGVKDFGAEGNKHVKSADKKPIAVDRDAPSVEEKCTQSAEKNRDELIEKEHKNEKNDSKNERVKTPPSIRYRPYCLKPKRNASPVNGLAEFKMSTRYRSALKRIESRKETRRSTGQEGEKEEFLSKLGLEKVEQ